MPKDRYKVISKPYDSGYGYKRVVVDTHNDDKPMRSYCALSDDYAFTNSERYCNELNTKEIQSNES